ncbi:MAG: methyltransferase domain-containing protein [Deltaproteobacteria bacterium]|nr:methyltransferase domain-containing protein [Deltaproteobacteria bacterium]
MFNAKKYKKLQALAWDGVAATFDRGFSGLALPATLKMIENARLEPGFQVLELATSTGSDAFLMAEQVGPSGRVTGIDLAPRMIDVAKATCAARGVENVEFSVMDAEELSFKPSSFDAVLCKWALEQFTDSHRALKEALRVLKPGGVFSSMVVGRPERSKFLSLGPLEIYRIDPALVTAESGAPSTFDLGAEGALEAAYNAAGFVNVQTRTLTLMITCADGASYWDLIWNGNGFMQHKLVQAGPSVTKLARLATMATADSFSGAQGIRLPFEVVIGWGEKLSKGKHAVQSSARLKSLDELAAEHHAVRSVSPAYAESLLGWEDTVFIDVRGMPEHVAGRIPGSHHAPRSVLETRIAEIVNPRTTTQIVVYSATGSSAVLAAATLASMGYGGVVAVQGGFAAWQGPVETGPLPAY